MLYLRQGAKKLPFCKEPQQKANILADEEGE
jgi:hypothetical protein